MKSTTDVEIVPCIDSPLYAPVYLAIIGLAKRCAAQVPERSSALPLSIGSQSFNLQYGPSAGGDVQVLTHLDSDEKSTLRIGICDPITVIERNYEETRSLRRLTCIPKYQIMGVFINKIALSLVTKKRRLPQARDKSGKPRTGLALEEYERLMAVHQIINQLKDDSLNVPGVFNRCDPHSRVKYSFWSKGRTTQYLVKHFLEIQTQERTEEGGGERRQEPSFIHPDQVLNELLTSHKDVAITHDPWTITSTAVANQFQFLCRECFPSIEFPFSCIVIPKAGRSPEYDTLLRHFMAALLEGLIVVTRHSGYAVKLLTDWAPFFRNYGLAHPDKVGSIISGAINHLLKIGCFAGNLIPQSTAWEYALAMDPDGWQARVAEMKEITGAETAWTDIAWEIVHKSLDWQFVEELPTDDDYLAGVRRYFLRAFKGPEPNAIAANR